MCCIPKLISCSQLCAVQRCFSHIQLFATPWTVAHWFLCAWVSPGKNTGVGGIASALFTARITWEAQVNYTSIKKINRRN